MTAARYSALRREIEVLLEFEDNPQARNPERLDALRLKIDKLAEEAPTIPERVWKRAEKKILSADAVQTGLSPVSSP